MEKNTQERIVSMVPVRAGIDVVGGKFVGVVGDEVYPAEIGEGLVGTTRELPDLLVTYASGVIKVISEAEIG